MPFLKVISYTPFPISRTQTSWHFLVFSKTQLVISYTVFLVCDNACTQNVEDFKGFSVLNPFSTTLIHLLWHIRVRPKQFTGGKPLDFSKYSAF